jgi:hypothetical protein
MNNIPLVLPAAVIYCSLLTIFHCLSMLLPSAAAAAALKAATRAGDKVAVPLNNNDAIFAEIRDLSIERLGGYLQEKAIHIRERYACLMEYSAGANCCDGYWFGCECCESCKAATT